MDTFLWEAEDISYSTFWNCFYTYIVAFVKKSGIISEEVDDIVHKVSEKTNKSWECRHTRSPKGTLAWVYSITRNAIKDHFREQQRRRQRFIDFQDAEAQEMFLESLASPCFSDSSYLQEQETRALLWEMIGDLSLEDRRLLGLYYTSEQRTLDMIATDLGISYETAKKRHQRVLKKLLLLLQQRGLEREVF